MYVSSAVLDELRGLLGHRLGKVEQHELLALTGRSRQLVGHLALHPRSFARDLLAVRTTLAAAKNAQRDAGGLDPQRGFVVRMRLGPLLAAFRVRSGLSGVLSRVRPQRRDHRCLGPRRRQDHRAHHHQADQHSPCDRDAEGLVRWLDQRCRGILPAIGQDRQSQPASARAAPESAAAMAKPGTFRRIFFAIRCGRLRVCPVLLQAAPSHRGSRSLPAQSRPDRGPIRLTERAGSLDASGHA